MKYSKRLEEEMKLSGGFCCYLLMEIIKKKKSQVFLMRKERF